MLSVRGPRGWIFRRGPARVWGSITLWGRRAVRWWRPRVAWLAPGIYRVWCSVGRAWSHHTYTVVSPFGSLHHVWGPAWSTGTYTAVVAGPGPAQPGWALPLRWSPVGGRFVGPDYYARSPGTSSKLLRHRGGWSHIALPSGINRWGRSDRLVHLGVRPNPEVRFIKWYKAGDTFVRGGRPRVRGVAMNPVDHPHGGGQGKTSGGRPGSTPWGVLTKGYKTVRS